MLKIISINRCLVLIFLLFQFVFVINSPVVAQNYNINAVNHQLANNHEVLDNYNANTYISGVNEHIQSILNEVTNSNFNLSSIISSIKASSITNFHPLEINIGNVRTDIYSNSTVTPAESIAVSQVLNHNMQSLILNDLGQAVGGTLNLTEFGPVNNLLIPHNVDGQINQGNFTVIENLVNYGNIYVNLNNTTSKLETITANNILEMTGSSIQGTGTAANSMVHDNLLLKDQTDFINFGTVSNFSDISINSNGNIVNQTDGQINSIAGINLSISSFGYLINNGLIDGQNINIAFNGNGQNLNPVIIGNGDFNSILGSVNIITSNIPSGITGGNTASASISDGFGELKINGVNFNGKNLNISAPNEKVILAANSISSIINVNSASLSAEVFKNSLNLGKIVETSDPTFFNVNGDVNIYGGINSPGGNVAVVAAGNINVSGGSINTGLTSSGTAGNVILFSGVNFSVTPSQTGQVNNDTNSILTITGLSSNVGQINLSGCTGIYTNITNPTNNPQLTGSGGSLTIVGYIVNIPNTCPIITGGYANGNNGSVSIIAGYNGVGPAITIGNIDTAGGYGGGGNIYMGIFVPTITQNYSGQVIIENGTYAPNSDTFTTASAQSGSIYINGNSIISGGGNVTIISGTLLDAPNLTINSSGLGGIPSINGNDVNGQNAGNIVLEGLNVSVNSLIACGGGGAGGGGGGVANFTSANGGVGGNGGNGGSITVSAPNGNFYCQSVIAASGGGGGGGGGAGGGIIGNSPPLPPGYGGNGGFGGQAGSVNINASLGVYLQAPIELGVGANGGNGGTSTNSLYGGGGGGGGASGGFIGFGGGGGAGGYGFKYSGAGGGGGASASGFGGGGGGGGNVNQTNGGGYGGGIDEGGLGGYNGGDTLKGTLGSNGAFGLGGNGGSYGIPFGYGGSFVNNIIEGGGGGSSAGSGAQSGQNGASLSLTQGLGGSINIQSTNMVLNGSGSANLDLENSDPFQLLLNPSTSTYVKGYFDAVNLVALICNFKSYDGAVMATSTFDFKSNTLGQSDPIVIASPFNSNININAYLGGFFKALDPVTVIVANSNPFVLSSQGSIIVQGGIYAYNIALATEENNAVISINGVLGLAGSEIFLTASGNSQINTNNGSILAASLLLYGGKDSAIGTSAVPLAINTNYLTVNTQGSVYLANSSPELNILTSSVGGTFSVISNANLVAGSNINEIGFVTANTLALYANGSIGIGTPNDPFNVNAAILGSSDYNNKASIYFNDSYSAGVTLLSNNVNEYGTVSITVPSTITLTEPLTGGIIALATTNNNGSIILGSTLGSGFSNIFLTSTGSGSVYQTNSSSVILGEYLTLASSSGSFQNLQIDVSSALQVSTGGTGSATIFDNATNVSINGALTGGSFTLYATGSIYAPESIYTGAGSNAIGGNIILADYYGTLNIGLNQGGHSTIEANNGSVIITNFNTGTGKININSGTIILGSSTNAALGNVAISIGSPIASNTAFSDANLSIMRNGAGNVYFGNNGIATNSPVNTLYANDRNIIFDTNVLPSSAITLGGNVNITADPPSVGSTNQITTFANNSSNNYLSVFGNIGQSNLDSWNYSINIFDNIQAGVNFVNDNDKMFESGNFFQPISCQIFRNQKYLTPNAILINADSDYSYKVNNAFELNFKKGTVALLINNGTALSLYNLTDKHSNSLVLETAGKSFNILPGCHITLTQNVSNFACVNQLPGLGYRSLKVVKLKNITLFTAQFSIIGLINEFKTLKLNRKLLSSILKTYAVLTVSQNNHEPFGQYKKNICRNCS